MLREQLTEECDDLEEALASVSSRLDAMRPFMFGDPDVSYARQPEATYSALLSELRDIESTMRAAGCALPSRPSTDARVDPTTVAAGMRSTGRLAAYLRDHHVPFQFAHHRPAYTAQAVAASEQLPGELVAKVVMVFADGRRVMLVLPAPHRVDFRKARAVMGARTMRLANEYELRVAFPDCEVGAMPPFGDLYGLPVFVDDDLAGDETIVCQAGTHTDTLSLRYTDFARVTHPVIARLCTRAS